MLHFCTLKGAGEHSKECETLQLINQYSKSTFQIKTTHVREKFPTI